MDIPKNMSTASLEQKLRQLKEQSQKQSQMLTQKLASSQSGQNLLHIGTSLSTLPPDLHSFLSQLHPLLSQSEVSEKEQLLLLEQLVAAAHEIRVQERRVRHANDCADMYADLNAAEAALQRDDSARSKQTMAGIVVQDDDDDQDSAEDELDDGVVEDVEAEELDHASSLERAAHITHCLVQELQSATDIVSALTTRMTDKKVPAIRTLLADDSEQAQFILKLAPRIRRLEADAIKCLNQHLEALLQRLQACREQTTLENNDTNANTSEHDILLFLGHIMRGLALLGRGKDVESTFARVAIMPIIRSKVSMGRLDEGGSRGECAGLNVLLEGMIETIASTFGSVLALSEGMFDVKAIMDVDLLTCGVWVPIATALMADAGIKMAIFSPGIASILQANYLSLDLFLSRLAQRLLRNDELGENDSPSLIFRPAINEARIRRAQERIYSHLKTEEFSKKWNLPIYYQLRFGECCARLNKSVDQTKREGWVADVFTGSVKEARKIRDHSGFQLPLFLELYDILLWLWRPDVILSPLTNRFLRGSAQVVGRMVAFVAEGMDGTIKFGDEPHEMNGAAANGTDGNSQQQEAVKAVKQYCWGENEIDVAVVAWELNILDSRLRHDYVTRVVDAIKDSASSQEEIDEITAVVFEVLKDSADQIHPIIDKAWGEMIVSLLVKKCLLPLGAVKGVAATYRMTNRPPPTHASPFVMTILKPLKDFSTEFADRTPDRVGGRWKHEIVVVITDRYATAVEELIATVQRTETALNSRRARRTSAGGMRDGEKVKLQLYLDYVSFVESVKDVGVEPNTVIGLSKLKELTVEGEGLMENGGDNGLSN